MNFSLPETTNQKGITFLFSVDNQYAGFFIKKNKIHINITLGWMTLKIFKVSEEKFNNIITVATLASSQGLEELIVNGKKLKDKLKKKEGYIDPSFF